MKIKKTPFLLSQKQREKKWVNFNIFFSTSTSASQSSWIPKESFAFLLS
jgi:hypothetical protein